MHYGAHSYIFTDRWTDDTLEVLETARELGLDCLEIAVGDDVVFDAPRVRHHAAALGLGLLISPGGRWHAISRPPRASSGNRVWPGTSGR